MPIIFHPDLPIIELGIGLTYREIAGADNGAERLTVRELTLQPGAVVDLHIHPEHQECIVVLEGVLEGRLGERHDTLQPGRTMLVPTAVKHGLRNSGDIPARALTIFPTDKVSREWIDGV